MSRSTCLGILFLLMIPGAALGSADTEETVVSTEICSSLWIVELVWAPEDREPQDLVAVFDTGAGRVFIDPDSLERISGKRVAEGRRAVMEDVFVAGHAFNTFKPTVQDLDHISRVLGRKLDVFLPFQTFASFLLTLDYQAGEMRIRKGELPEPDQVRIFDARGRDDRPWLKVSVGGIEHTLLIDSGSSGNINVHSNKKFDWAVDPIPLRLFQGMYDVELMKVGRLRDDLQVGSLTFSRPVVTLTEDTELLGAEILRNFVLTFDQANKTVRMDPVVPGPVTSPSYRGTGAVMQPRDDNYEVVRVIAGSPAEAQGLQPGDQVTHIDGVQVYERGCRGLDDKKGDTTTLTVAGDGTTRQVTMPVVVLVP